MAEPSDTSSSPDTAVPAFADRLARLAEQAGSYGADVILIAPGPDLEYFIGHSVASHERLTCLVVPATGDPALLVPTLERLGWTGTPAESLGLPITTWTDGEDPYLALAGLLPADARVLAVDYHMPAVHALNAQAIVPGSELTLAGEAIAELRMRKGADEVDALAAAGAAIDRVQRRIGEWLHAGPHRERGGRRHRGGDRRRGSRPAGFRHRRIRAERRQPAPRGLGPDDRARRPGGDRHRRPDAVRLLLRLHPDLRGCAGGRCAVAPEGARRCTRSSAGRRRPASRRFVPASAPNRSTPPPGR